MEQKTTYEVYYSGGDYCVVEKVTATYDMSTSVTINSVCNVIERHSTIDSAVRSVYDKIYALTSGNMGLGVKIL